MKLTVALISSVGLLAVAAFCLFGFLATFEPTDRENAFLTFRIGYVVAGIGCLVAIIGLIAWSLRKSPSRSRELT